MNEVPMEPDMLAAVEQMRAAFKAMETERGVNGILGRMGGFYCDLSPVLRDEMLRIDAKINGFDDFGCALEQLLGGILATVAKNINGDVDRDIFVKTALHNMGGYVREALGMPQDYYHNVAPVGTA